MRRSDREIVNFEDIVKVMEKCDVCRLALNDEVYPYILPLNFGMQVIENKITLYFHGATEGKKYDLIKKNNKASFEMDCSHRLVSSIETGDCTMEYESVIGNGVVEMVENKDKYNALDILMRHYHREGFPINEKMIAMTNVFKLTVENVTGKAIMV